MSTAQVSGRVRPIDPDSAILSVLQGLQLHARLRRGSGDAGSGTGRIPRCLHPWRGTRGQDHVLSGREMGAGQFRELTPIELAVLVPGNERQGEDDGGLSDCSELRHQPITDGGTGVRLR